MSSINNVWLPLESNPDVMNKYLHALGVPSTWNMVDILGLDSEMLEWVPRPVLAVILLFPWSEKRDVIKNKEDAEILVDGQKVSENVFYMKQMVSNACGTIAVVHSVANNADRIELMEDGIMKKYLEEAKGLDPAARGALLENYKDVVDTHSKLALEGQTEAPNAEDPVNHHFVAFIEKDGCLYELDGRRSFPINHGLSSPDSFLEDAAKICRKFMEQDPEEVRFTVVGLTATQD